MLASTLMEQFCCTGALADCNEWIQNRENRHQSSVQHCCLRCLHTSKVSTKDIILRVQYCLILSEKKCLLSSIIQNIQIRNSPHSRLQWQLDTIYFLNSELWPIPPWPSKMTCIGSLTGYSSNLTVRMKHTVTCMFHYFIYTNGSCTCWCYLNAVLAEVCTHTRQSLICSLSATRDQGEPSVTCVPSSTLHNPSWLHIHVHVSYVFLISAIAALNH